MDEAARADKALDQIANSGSLPPLNQENLLTVMEQMVEAHAGAYGWEPSLEGEELLERIQQIFPARDTKLRTRIRAGIQWLDHLLQYGQPPVFQVSDLLEDQAAGELDDADLRE
ncbi:MAG: hypothetical protein AB1445_02455 [Bacillota bacterium]